MWDCKELIDGIEAIEQRRAETTEAIEHDRLGDELHWLRQRLREREDKGGRR
jgi:hypothetical protein